MLDETFIGSPVFAGGKRNGITFILESDSADTIAAFNAAVFKAMAGLVEHKYSYSVMLRFAGDDGDAK